MKKAKNPGKKNQPNLLYIESYIRIMIDNGATQIELFDTINQIIKLNLSKAAGLVISKANFFAEFKEIKNRKISFWFL